MDGDDQCHDHRADKQAHESKSIDAAENRDHQDQGIRLYSFPDKERANHVVELADDTRARGPTRQDT